MPLLSTFCQSRFRVWGLVRVYAFISRVQSPGAWASFEGLGSRFHDSRFRVQGLGFMIQGFRVLI